MRLFASAFRNRRVTEVHDAGAERLGAGEREGYLAVRFAEEPLAAADHQREDEQVQLVKQAVPQPAEVSVLDTTYFGVLLIRSAIPPDWPPKAAANPS